LHHSRCTCEVNLNSDFRYTRRICIDSFDCGGVQYDSSSSLCFCKVHALVTSCCAVSSR
jgi:hypothetical protein